MPRRAPSLHRRPARGGTPQPRVGLWRRSRPHRRKPGDSDRDPLAEVVTTLPPAHQEVLLLRFVDGFSLNEIAEALEIPLGTVKSRLHHALDSLRQDGRTRKFFEQ